MRKHIRIQQQLKLHIEGIEERLEELEFENDELASKIVISKKKHEMKLKDAQS